MSDDFSPKLDQIKDMLSQPGMQENIKNLMGIIPNNSSQSNNTDSAGINVEMLNKIKTVMDKKNQMNDPRLNLLNAIKPYLGQKRQTKIDSYSKLLHVSTLSNLFKDLT